MRAFLKKKKARKRKKRKIHLDSACEGFSFQPLNSSKLSRTSAIHSQGTPTHTTYPKPSQLLILEGGREDHGPCVLLQAKHFCFLVHPATETVRRGLCIRINLRDPPGFSQGAPGPFSALSSPLKTTRPSIVYTTWGRQSQANP